MPQRSLPRDFTANDTFQLVHGRKFRLGRSLARINDALVRILPLLLMFQKNAEVFQQVLTGHFCRLIDTELQLGLKFRMKVCPALPVRQVGRKLGAGDDYGGIIVQPPRATSQLYISRSPSSVSRRPFS